jgi:hypothetical protein
MLEQCCIEHIISGVIRMVLENLKKILERSIGNKDLQPHSVMKIADWIHNLEFLVIRVMMFAIGVHHLYVYTMKVVF